MHGRLEGDSCVCDTGYTGKLCNRCDTSLGYKTQDSAGNCFTDADCTKENYCNGRGWAGLDWLNQCACITCEVGYYGEHCELGDGTKDICNGNAYYDFWHNVTGLGSGCNCKDGYWGNYCEYKTSEKAECNGHGTEYGYGQCLCYEGYVGQYCEEEDVNAKTCGKIDQYKRTGILREINGETWCECISGWGGDDCRTKL